MRSVFTLTHLADGPVNQQALIDLLGVDPSTLVAVLNELEGLGLASRQRDTADRRRHIVTITPKGTEPLHAVDAVPGRRRRRPLRRPVPQGAGSARAAAGEGRRRVLLRRLATSDWFRVVAAGGGKPGRPRKARVLNTRSSACAEVPESNGIAGSARMASAVASPRDQLTEPVQRIGL
ncbi:MarR family transcriptional regulator [Dactylosporangium sp. NPDC049525]|uniref:MarR family winged helix-turn-helix transcriptional regulator n=1 Tax=Dactylosporangium sp. NPDC049525 TaxID=3154730 RepID=UPI003419A57D